MGWGGGGVIARQLLGATLAKFVNKKKQYTKPWHDEKTGIQHLVSSPNSKGQNRKREQENNITKRKPSL